MKFKNSYILLIAMAIFLLVSIGSVCASDNVTANSDNPLASADADVELTADNTDSGSSTQDTINTTVTASGKAKYDINEDKNITVTVKDNETKDVKVNQSELSIYEGNTSINFVYNNSIVKISDTLSEGTHNLVINYLGNANYTNFSTKFQLNIAGEKTLDAYEEAIRDGDTIKIKGITLHEGVEYIELTKDNFKVTLTYINATGNETSVDITDFRYNNGTLNFTSDKKWVAAGVTLNYTGAANTVTSLIYLTTKVEATSSETVRDTEDKNITVKVLDCENVELNVTEKDFQLIVDRTYTDFTYNNSVITIKDLAVGKHTIIIIYLGNNTYCSNFTNVTLNVNGNLTISPNDVATLDSDRNAVITLNLTDGVELKDIEKDKMNITLNYSNKTGNYTKVIDDLNITGQNVTFKVAEAFDKAHVTIKYAAETNLTANVTIKVETAINCDDVIVKGDSGVINFTANVTASDGHVLNVTSDNFKVYNGDKLVNSTYNNSAITITDKLTLGNYNLTIKFIGDDTYNTVTKDIVLKVYGIKLNTTTANVNSTKKGEVKLNISDGVTDFDFTKDDLTITVSYKDSNNATVNVTVKDWSVKNGTIFFELDEANFTQANMTIVYNKTAVANATLNRIYNMNITAVNVVVDFQDGNLTFKIIDIDTRLPLANKTVSITISKNGTNCYFITKNGSSYSIGTSTTVTTDENGVATLVNKNFYPELVMRDNLYAPAGDDYKITVSLSGVTKGTFTTNITINKIDVKIVLGTFNEYYGTSKKVTITVTNAKTGKTVSGVYVYLNITGATLASPSQLTDENGTIQLGVSGLPTGSYSMSFKANDTNLNNASGSGKFNINKIPVVISGNNVKIYFNTGATYTLKVTKDGKGISGVYVFVRLYKTSKKYEDYIFQTNSKGQVSFSASLAVGSHKIIVTLADTRYTASQITKTIKVVKATAKLKAKKVKTYYKGGKYFTIKLINKKNKKPIYDAKVNIKIFVTSTKYYNYNGNTGANGKIKLSLDTLKPGKYVVVAGNSLKNYTAKAITSKIVIKKAPTKLVPKKLTAKKGKNAYFKVTVKNKKNKKVIPKVKIKVKVYTGKKYKTYTLKTNAKGIAKLNVKKLKAGKHKVIVTSANKYCVAKNFFFFYKIKNQIYSFLYLA